MNKTKTATGILSLILIPLIFSGCSLTGQSDIAPPNQELESLKSEIEDLKQQKSGQTQAQDDKEAKKEEELRQKEAEEAQKTTARDEARKKCLAKVQALYDQKMKEINNISTTNLNGSITPRGIESQIESEAKMKSDMRKSVFEKSKEAKNDCYREYPVK